MQNRNIWFFAAVALVFIMLFCNRKVWLWAVLKEQISVFRNAKKEKVSLWDCLCFFVFPWVVSYICTCKLNFVIKDDLAELLTTVFSIVFTVLFGFAAVMVSKIDSDNKKEKQVAEETFVSIVSSTVLSLIAAVLSIILTQIKNVLCLQIISAALVTISLVIIMLLLLITKRTFYLYVNNKK